MLNLGCGNGRLALRFSDWFEKIVGLDTEPEEAKSISKKVRVGNTEWFIGDFEKYKSQYYTTVTFVTIAKAFHWMDRPLVLGNLFEMIAVGGGLALSKRGNVCS